MRLSSASNILNGSLTERFESIIWSESFFSISFFSEIVFLTSSNNSEKRMGLLISAAKISFGAANNLNMVYNTILSKEKPHKLAVLIDPDKGGFEAVFNTLNICNKSKVDFIMIGGSLVSQPIDYFVAEVKKRTNLPVVLFPGSLFQITDNADAILLLSLISGRNPEYLIGNHVLAAPILKRSKLEIIPTGYILVNSGQVTSVQYISNTNPIPSDKADIAVATAMAGEMLGHKLIYLEAGSGAQYSVPIEMIKAVKQSIQIPLIVGGGIRTREQLLSIYDAGADIAVIGNSLENNPERLKDIIYS